MRKLSIILLGLAGAILTGAAQIKNLGKIVLAETSQAEGVAICSFPASAATPVCAGAPYCPS